MPETYRETEKPHSFPNRDGELYLADRANNGPGQLKHPITDTTILRVQTATKQTRNTIAIDLDGVIAIEHHLDFEKKTPNQKIIDRMWALQEKGWRIVIHTARMDMDVDITKAWLLMNNVPCDHIIFNKPLARYYVDDRNLSMADFLNGSIDEGNK